MGFLSEILKVGFEKKIMALVSTWTPHEGSKGKKGGGEPIYKNRIVQITQFLILNYTLMYEKLFIYIILVAHLFYYYYYHKIYNSEYCFVFLLKWQKMNLPWHISSNKFSQRNQRISKELAF